MIIQNLQTHYVVWMMKILATKLYMKKIFNMTVSNLFHRYHIQDTVCEITHSNKKFREELLAYFPFKQHGPRRKLRLQQLFVAAGMRLTSYWFATIREYTEKPTDVPSRSRSSAPLTLFITNRSAEAQTGAENGAERCKISTHCFTLKSRFPLLVAVIAFIQSRVIYLFKIARRHMANTERHSSSQTELLKGGK
jgi:hypothetical protein